MIRYAAIVFVLLLVSGCGKSFTEAEAIWKDETAKLEAMQDEWESEVRYIYSLATVHDAGDKVKQSIKAEAEREYGEEDIIGQSRFVDARHEQIQAAMDAAAKPLMDELQQRKGGAIAAQKKRVEEAYKAKEAAKH